MRQTSSTIICCRCRIGRRFRWRTPRRRCSAQATRNYMPHGMRWHTRLGRAQPAERSAGYVRVGASNLLGRGRVGCRHIGGTLPNVNVSVVPPEWQNRHEQRRCDQYGQHNVDDHAAGRPVRRQPHSTLLQTAGWRGSRMHVNTALTHCTRTAWIGTAKPAHGSAPKPPSRPSPSRLRDVTYTAVATTNPTGSWSLRRRCRLRHDTDMFLLVRMSPIHDGFDVIAIRVQHECGVIAGTVRARTGSAAVARPPASAAAWNACTAC